MNSTRWISVTPLQQIRLRLVALDPPSAHLQANAPILANGGKPSATRVVTVGYLLVAPPSRIDTWQRFLSTSGDTRQVLSESSARYYGLILTEESLRA